MCRTGDVGRCVAGARFISPVGEKHLILVILEEDLQWVYARERLMPNEL